jgi:hypothetical protein
MYGGKLDQYEDVSPMKDDERALLRALSLMCTQYIDERDGVGHECIGAGVQAIELLVRCGMIEPSGRGGRWTEAGAALMH